MVIIAAIAIACCLYRMTEAIRRDRFGLGPTLYIEIAALAIGLVFLLFANGPRADDLSIVFCLFVILTAICHTIILVGKASAAANPPC